MEGLGGTFDGRKLLLTAVVVRDIAYEEHCLTQTLVLKKGEALLNALLDGSTAELLGAALFS